MWSYAHDGFTVHQIPALQDNYIYLIETDEMLACVDPAESKPVEAACGTLGRKLTHVLNTHHHWDHVGGNVELKSRYGCAIVGPSYDATRIPALDQPVSEGKGLQLGNLDVSVLFV
ncbi:MAG: MBL fold metallo-hydrolase, partial [Mariprofundaceae bacterium]|nr:MBL fold metallo-hydrolase [Mariprofundaceae bacterium]